MIGLLGSLLGGRGGRMVGSVVGGRTSDISPHTTGEADYSRELSRGLGPSYNDRNDVQDDLGVGLL